MTGSKVCPKHHIPSSVLPSSYNASWCQTSDAPSQACDSSDQSTLSMLNHYSFLEQLMLDTDHCKPGTPHQSCSFAGALTQSSRHHNLVPVKLTQIHTLAHFSSLYLITFEDKMLLAKLSHLLTSAVMKRQSVILKLPVSAHNVMPKTHL